MNVVEQWRQYKGWTYEEFGKKAGMTGSTIGTHCTVDKKLRSETVKKLAKAVGVTPEVFRAGPPKTVAPSQTSHHLTKKEMQGKIIEIAYELDEEELTLLFGIIERFVKGLRINNHAGGNSQNQPA
jgi:transcriptional regulator with XRE-family HTH domain